MPKRKEKQEIVLVGTYRHENESWIREHRLYNLPLPDFFSRKERKGCKDGMAVAPHGRAGAPRTPYGRAVAPRPPQTAAERRVEDNAPYHAALPFHRNISGIVLFAEGHPNFAFKAKFKNVVDGAWLAANGYGRAACPHAAAYALYELTEESTPAKLLGRKTAEVFVSSSRCPCVKIDEAFYSKPYPVTGGKSMPYVFDCLKPYFRKWKSATTFNPVQMDFFLVLDSTMKKAVPFPPPKPPKFTFIDLFAGIGGIRLGFQAVGGKCIYSSEFDQPAQKTYEANFGEVPFGDITKQETKDAIPDEIDVVCAGFPCQAFSMAGKRMGFNDNYKGMCRGTLFKEVVEICENHKPKVVFCENVKGLLIHDKGRTLQVIKGAFEEIGYHFYYTVLNSKDFGVPQHRERLYMIALRNDIVARLSRGNEKWSFPFPKPSGKNVTLQSIREFEVPARYYLSTTYVETLRRHKAHHEALGHGFGYQIRDWNGTSGAIVCGGMGREGNLVIDKTDRKLVPETHIKGTINTEGIRKMTPREWARLQGFPEEFRFVLSDVHLYKQFGNSVTVPVIKAIASKIMKEVYNG